MLLWVIYMKEYKIRLNNSSSSYKKNRLSQPASIFEGILEIGLLNFSLKDP